MGRRILGSMRDAPILRITDSAVGNPTRPATFLRPNRALVLLALQQKQAVHIVYPTGEELRAVPHPRESEADLVFMATTVVVGSLRTATGSWRVDGPRPRTRRWLIGEELAGLVLRAHDSGSLPIYLRRLTSIPSTLYSAPISAEEPR